MRARYGSDQRRSRPSRSPSMRRRAGLRDVRSRFLRARSPEEKDLRRKAILVAARSLIDDHDTIDFSLNDVARRARMSKPNLYRYFESREEILLLILIKEVRTACDRLQAAF